MFNSGMIFDQDNIQKVSGPVRRALTEFSTRVTRSDMALGVPRARVPFDDARAVGFLVLYDRGAFALVVDLRSAGGVPSHKYLPWTPPPPPNSTVRERVELALAIASHHFGFGEAYALWFGPETLEENDALRNQAIAFVADQTAQSLARQFLHKQIAVPAGFDHIADRFMPSFLRDHPDWRRNVFLMMRFEEKPYFAEIEQTVRNTLGRYRLNGVRADDRAYSPDLWENVCTYMLGCSYGVVVFEEIDQREFNPSVALELGFMMAQNKRCLILKDKRMPAVPTDIVGKLYETFDAFQIATSVSKAIDNWARDLGTVA